MAEVEIERSITKITLTLNENEAGVIMKILGKVGGNDVGGSFRATCNSVYYALYDAGITKVEPKDPWYVPPITITKDYAKSRTIK